MTVHVEPLRSEDCGLCPSCGGPTAYAGVDGEPLACDPCTFGGPR